MFGLWFGMHLVSGVSLWYFPIILPHFLYSKGESISSKSSSFVIGGVDT